MSNKVPEKKNKSKQVSSPSPTMGSFNTKWNVSAKSRRKTAGTHSINMFSPFDYAFYVYSVVLFVLTSAI